MKGTGSKLAKDETADCTLRHIFANNGRGTVSLPINDFKDSLTREVYFDSMPARHVFNRVFLDCMLVCNQMFQQRSEDVIYLWSLFSFRPMEEQWCWRRSASSGVVWSASWGR